MVEARSITIVGGGLAGLTLGIGLRQRGVPVRLHEAGIYPRHRVCGEFISGRGQATLARLGLSELLAQAGAVHAQTAAFYTTTQATPPRPLPAPAVCLSRFTLDAALANKFRELGGDLRESSRVTTAHFSEGTIHATGRRAPTEENGPHWFGLKIHARNVTLAADLEMHLSPQGYVGLCRINDGEVNICGLFRKRATSKSEPPKNWRDLLRGSPGSWLNQRLTTAVFDDRSFCAVAGLSLRPQCAAASAEIGVGDVITMIPPLTGNGMSMAFESAELALAPLAAWSRGETPWATARQRIAQDCDAAFSSRLGWAKWLQRLAQTPALQAPVVALAARSAWFWRQAFEHTR